MTTRLNPYLSFAGDAAAALAFYQDVFGGDLTINHFGDFGTDDHGIGDQVMHGQLETPSGLTLMAADMLPGETLRPGNNFAVSLNGGIVTVELTTQPWGDEFGMCVDRFGTSWLVNIARTD
jgi:PhnB protein